MPEWSKNRAGFLDLFFNGPVRPSIRTIYWHFGETSLVEPALAGGESYGFLDRSFRDRNGN
ncbi:MAG TPA: hypothetical protein DGU45_09590 [Planctomycetes bacterium]|nr:hypothetical protein [Planctomycetota bacterium]